LRRTEYCGNPEHHEYELYLAVEDIGQAKAKAAGRYRGRPEDTAKNARIARMLNAGISWSQIQDTLHCSRGTVAKVALRMRQEEAAA
jgi:DNA invertase Pin-like site-specific DNA recombinase